MKASNFKWLFFNKVIKSLVLDSDSSVSVVSEHMYCNLQLNIESYHDNAITLLPVLSTLVPSYSFVAMMLPLTSYDSYHEALAFFKKLANHICSLLEDSKFSARAPTACQGLQFIQSSEAHDLAMLFCMLIHTIHHLGALGFNPQKLIDALGLMTGDNAYNIMSKVLEVDKSVRIS